MPIFNEVFEFYGKNVYKIGTTVEIKKRAAALSTPFLNPIEFVFISKPFKDKYGAESMIFDKLEKYRIKSHKEFFQVKLDIVIKIIKEMEDVEYGIGDLTERMTYVHISKGPSKSTKKNGKMMFVESEKIDIYKHERRKIPISNIIRYKKPTKVTDFPVSINNIIVYYATDKYKYTRFMNTYKYKLALKNGWEFE